MSRPVPPQPPAAVPWFRDRPGGGARVLVEDGDPASRRALERRLRDEGHEVVSCAGPEALSRRRCPLEEGDTCPAVDEADVVVTTLHSAQDRLHHALAGTREQHPETPVVVRSPALLAHRNRHRLEGCVVLPLAADPVAAVTAALAGTVEGSGADQPPASEGGAR